MLDLIHRINVLCVFMILNFLSYLIKLHQARPDIDFTKFKLIKLKKWTSLSFWGFLIDNICPDLAFFKHFSTFLS